MREYVITSTRLAKYPTGAAIRFDLEEAGTGIKRVVAIPYQCADQRHEKAGRRVFNAICNAAGKVGVMDTSELRGAKVRAKIGRDRFSTGGVGCPLILAAMPAPDDAEVIVPFGRFLAGREGEQFAADYRTEVAAGRLRPDISSTAMLAFLTGLGAPPETFDEFRRLLREYRARLPAGCGEREAASAILQAA